MGFFTFDRTPRLHQYSGSYFLLRMFIAFAVPLTLASLGPATSHPELGTDMKPVVQRTKSQVYRASDVRMQSAMEEAQKAREVVKLQAYRRGQKVHLKRRNES